MEIWRSRSSLTRPHRILSRTYSLILDLINAQEELVALKKGGAKGGLTADAEKKYKLEIGEPRCWDRSP